MNMIERVAMAIADSHGKTGHTFEDDARAAIKAMRNPAFDVESVSYHEGMSRRDWWEAMIDAALQE